MNNIRTSYNAIWRVGGVLTVDSDGNGLGENEAVGALKGRDLAELVDLEVVGRDALGRLGVDKLNVEAVLLCDGKEGGGARVTLVGCQFWASPKIWHGGAGGGDIRCSCKSFRKT